MSRKIEEREGRRNSVSKALSPLPSTAAVDSPTHSVAVNPALSHLMRGHSNSFPNSSDLGMPRSSSEDTLSSMSDAHSNSLSLSTSSSPSTPSKLHFSEGRIRSGSDADLTLQQPPSPTRSRADTGSRLEAAKGSPSSKVDKKDLSKRLSARLFGFGSKDKSSGGAGSGSGSLIGGRDSSSSGGGTDSRRDSRGGTPLKSQPASYYVGVLKKKAATRIDLLSLQEDLKVQGSTWHAKFEEEGGIGALEPFIAHVHTKTSTPVPASAGEKEKAVAEADVELGQELIRLLAMLYTPSVRQHYPSLLKPAFVSTVVACLQTSNKLLKMYVLTLLADVLQLPRVGQQLVLQGLEALQKQRQDSSRFMVLVGALMGADVPTELKAVVLMLVNMLLQNTEELEARFEMRNEILSLGLAPLLNEMKATTDEELALQLEMFEDGSSDDYQVMVTRKKNIRAYAAKKDSAYRPKNYCRVFITKDGVTTSTVIPFAEGKTARDITTTITNKHPVADVSMYGILADKDGTEGEWLDEAARLMEDLQLSGEVTCEFKMKDWTLTLKSPLGALETATVSPLLTVSDVVSQLTKRFSLPTTEEYGLYISGSGSGSGSNLGGFSSSSSSCSSSSGGGSSASVTPAQSSTALSGYWLVENKQLHTFPDVSQKGRVLELRSKPKALRVRFKDDAQESLLITGTTLVRDVLEELAAKVGIPREHLVDYGLFLDPSSSAQEGVWLDEARPLLHYGLHDGMGAVRFLLRPTPLTVVLPDRTETTVPVHVTAAVKDVVVEICEHAKLDPDDGYSLHRRLAPARTPRTQPANSPRPVQLSLSTSAIDSPASSSPTSPGSPALSRHASGAAFNGGSSPSTASATAAATATASLSSLSQPMETVPLDDWKSLREQNAGQGGTVLVLVRDAKKKKGGRDEAGPNIWEERGGDRNVIWSEQLNKEGKREIACASLNKLVEHLTSEKEYDIDFMKTFLITYRSFATTEMIVRKLSERWQPPPSAGLDAKAAGVVKLRICTLVQHWLERLDDPSALDLIAAFVQKHVAAESTYENLSAKLKTQIENRRAAPKTRVYNFHNAPPPVIPLRQNTAHLSILDIDELEAARQLTLTMFDLYQKIRPMEFFGLAWNNPKLRDRSPNVCANIEFFNKVAQWTACLMLSEPTLAARVKLLKCLITVSLRLRDLNNYNLMTAIVSGLNNSAVLRLKWTRLKLPKQLSKALEELEELTNMEGSYRNFRRELEHAVLPCLPYLGVYLVDLTFIEEGNPDVKNGLINWDKRKLVNNIIGQIQKFQMVGYNLTREERVLLYFQQSFAAFAGFSDRDLYSKSLEYEPRNAQRGDIK